MATLDIVDLLNLIHNPPEFKTVKPDYSFDTSRFIRMDEVRVFSEGWSHVTLLWDEPGTFSVRLRCKKTETGDFFCRDKTLVIPCLHELSIKIDPDVIEYGDAYETLVHILEDLSGYTPATVKDLMALALERNPQYAQEWQKYAEAQKELDEYEDERFSKSSLAELLA